LQAGNQFFLRHMVRTVLGHLHCLAARDKSPAVSGFAYAGDRWLLACLVNQSENEPDLHEDLRGRISGGAAVGWINGIGLRAVYDF
jgi:hypothetical protein